VRKEGGRYLEGDIPRCDVGKLLKKIHTWSGGTGVRTRDLPNVKWRVRPLTTVLGDCEVRPYHLMSCLIKNQKARLVRCLQTS
jgi:hypothetical protein